MPPQNTLILPHTEAKRRFIVSIAVHCFKIDNFDQKSLIWLVSDRQEDRHTYLHTQVKNLDVRTSRGSA